MLATAAALLAVIGALVCIDLAGDIATFAGQEQRSLADIVGLATPILVTAAHLALGLGATLAWWWRRQPRRSRRVLLAAFGASLPLQVLPRLVPTAWYLHIDESQRAVAGPLLAIGGMIDLLPLLLSVTVGLARAGMRRMRILPGDPAGATFAFVANLQLALLLAVVFAGIEPVARAPWLRWGVALPLGHYVVSAAVCLQCARRRRISRRAALVLVASAVGLLLPGIGCLAMGLGEVRLLDLHLIAWGDRPGIYPPSHLAVEGVLFGGRAVITAVAAADLIAAPPSGDDAARSGDGAAG